MKKLILVSLAPVLLAGCFGSEPEAPSAPTPAATATPAATTPAPAAAATPAPTAAAVTPPAVFTADAFVGLSAELICLPHLQMGLTSDQNLLETAKILQKYGATEENIAAFRLTVRDEDKPDLKYKVLGKAEELCQISQQAAPSAQR